MGTLSPSNMLVGGEAVFADSVFRGIDTAFPSPAFNLLAYFTV